MKLFSYIQNDLINSFPEIFAEEEVDLMDSEEISSYIDSINLENINLEYLAELESFHA